MTDAEFGDFIAPNETPENKAKLVVALSDKRATLEAMADLCSRIALYEAGLGPKPMDAIICGPNEIREGRGPRQRRNSGRAL